MPLGSIQLAECRARDRVGIVGCGARGEVVGACLLGEASGVGLEMCEVPSGVVEPRREVDHLAGLGRHRGQVRAPGARPGREVFVGVADCGAALPEQSRAGEDGLGGLARSASLRGPGVFQRGGGVLRTRGDGRFEATQPSAARSRRGREPRSRCAAGRARPRHAARSPRRHHAGFPSELGRPRVGFRRPLRGSRPGGVHPTQHRGDAAGRNVLRRGRPGRRHAQGRGRHGRGRRPRSIALSRPRCRRRPGARCWHCGRGSCPRRPTLRWCAHRRPGARRRPFHLARRARCWRSRARRC